jgi:replicative DNA helicase
LTDFPSKFEKYIFSAIEGLYKNGAIKINPIDIENFLEVNPAASQIFKDKNGIEYLQDIIELSEVDNFDFYYNRFKKFNLLKDLKKQGFDVSEFYCEDLTNPKSEEINQAFNFLFPKDITDAVRKKLLGIEAKYETTDEVEIETAATGMSSLVDELGAAYEIGMPVQGNIYNQVIDGAKKGTLTIRSAASGVGKTSNAIADACYLAYPFRYNSITCEWEQVGNSERVLFIVTEQRFKEVRLMILAYLTDINRSRFKYADFSERESAVIEQAIHLMKKYEDNLILVKMPNPTIESVKTIVRENCIVYDVGYVFYDYIFIGPSLLNEFKGFALRNDEVLLMFATALKDLAVELDVAMFTSTQLNAKGDDNKDIRNEGTLAGGRSTINKADNGAIMARPTKEELEILEPLYENNPDKKPNLVTDIFKVRSGEWTQVRIWSDMNLGTLKKRDLFITDSRMEPVESFNERSDYQIKSWDEHEDEHLKIIVERLNNGEIID